MVNVPGSGPCSAACASVAETVTVGFSGGGGTYLKKLATGGTRVDPVRVGTDAGLWISGGPHVVGFPRRSPRLAGNVLLWEHGRTTYRLEGPSLARDDAIEFVQSLRKG